ncbi:related to endoglucanase c [Rhynchosporium agropyri]|uniref:Related to endoglucanase c n=1 Tax=Rhynchosporium agropyri TaxID=914238 RepID=A0A1E1LMG7_9HELO|nr:related to endoglucanase c [Rhynchosporium agropyri]
MRSTSIYSAILALASIAVAQNCPIAFDGRIPAGSTPALFDTESSPFGTGYVKGKDLNFSQIIKLPSVPASLFDASGKSMALEVTLSDKSIFAPSATNVQVGFRRAELQFDGNSGKDNFTLGVKTLHFSVQKDAARPLNTSHEYQLVFLEDSSYSTNQFVLKYGTIVGQAAGQNPDSLVLLGNVNASPVVSLFKTSFTAGVFHNFAVTLNFDANTVTVLYSQGTKPLAVVNGPTKNDLSGQGQYHVGCLKKPTGQGIKDPSKEGFQPTGINEGIIYGGIFMEDSTGGCVSKSGSATRGTTAAAGTKPGTGAGGNKKDAEVAAADTCP